MFYRTLIPAAVNEEVNSENHCNHTKSKRRSSKKGKMTIEEKLTGIKCPDDNAVSAWNCPVCLYILRLELRMNFGIIPNYAK